MTFEVGQGVSGINPQILSCLGVGTRLIFRVISLFKIWSVVSPGMLKQNLADLFGVSMYYCLTYLESFVILAQNILM